MPKSWATSLEVPTLYRTVDGAGKKRLIPGDPRIKTNALVKGVVVKYHESQGV